ncbi:MAG: serine protease [Pseudomonadota bacterium]|nr:serine protease [Pseudomonadota bacterium]
MSAKPAALLLSAWLCISLSACLQPAHADIAEILPRIKSSIAGVGTLHPLRNPRIKLLGTGFVVADGQHVVTNAHVAPLLMEEEKGESIAVFLRGPEGIIVRKAEKVASDAEHDLLLLKIEGEAVPALKLGNSELAREGQLYYFTGFPIGAVLGLYPATHRAGLAAIAPIFSPPPGTRNLTAKLIKRADNPFLMFQLDATAYPGNSGSPLYDGNTGAVVGVINSVFVKGAKENVLRDPSGITYAIPAKYIQALLENAGLLTAITRGSATTETGAVSTPAVRGKR